MEPATVVFLGGVATVAAGAFWYMGHWMRAGGLVGKAATLIAAARFDEAYALLSQVDRSALPAWHRSVVAMQLGLLTWLRGEHELALEWYVRAAKEGEGTVRSWSQFQQAHLLVILGRDEERARLELPFDDASKVMRQELQLAEAFYADRPDELPGAAVLARWADTAVERRNTGDALIYLAWAFWRRGDLELARTYVLTGASLMKIPLHLSQPKLDAWLQERLRAWS